MSDVPATTTPIPAALYTREQVDLLKHTIADGTTDLEFKLFMEVARRRGLDPFSGQIHAVRREGKLSIQTGIDGFRSLAADTGRYGGQLADEWCGPDGQWVDVWLDNEPPAAARAHVVHLDHPDAGPAVAKYSEYVQRNRDGQPNHRWAQAPAAQLAKCAAALAFRRAFPQQLGGIYTDDEMGQADNPEPPTVEVQETASRRPTRYDQQRYPQPQRAQHTPPAVEEQSTKMGATQLRRIMALFTDGDIRDRDERLTMSTALLDRDLDRRALETTNELTKVEADDLIRKLATLTNAGPTLREAYQQAEVDREGAAADGRAAEQEAAARDGADPGEEADNQVFGPAPGG